MERPSHASGPTDTDASEVKLCTQSAQAEAIRGTQVWPADEENILLCICNILEGDVKPLQTMLNYSKRVQTLPQPTGKDPALLRTQ